MDLWAIKTFAMLIIFLAILIPSVLSIKVYEWVRNRGERGAFTLSVIACFGAGSFLGAYMMHLAPDVEYLTRVYWLEPSGIHYPLHQLLFGVGIFLLIFIEQVMYCVNDMLHRRQTRSNQQSAHREQEENLDSGVDFSLGGSPFSGEYVIDSTVDIHTETSPGRPRTSSQGSEAESTDELLEEDVQKLESLKLVVMFVALSLDGIFEGLTLGLQDTEARVWSVVIVILSHEVVISFVLGFEIRKQFTVKVTILMCFIYALSNPIGSAIGTTVHAILRKDGLFALVAGISQAVCGGVFIYITFIGILSREIVGTRNNGVRTIALFFGFAVMAALKLVPHGNLYEPGGGGNGTACIGEDTYL